MNDNSLEEEHDVGKSGQDYHTDQENVLSRRRAFGALEGATPCVVGLALGTEHSTIARSTFSFRNIILVIRRAQTSFRIETANEVGGFRGSPPESWSWSYSRPSKAVGLGRTLLTRSWLGRGLQKKLKSRTLLALSCIEVLFSFNALQKGERES